MKEERPKMKLDILYIDNNKVYYDYCCNMNHGSYMIVKMMLPVLKNEKYKKITQKIRYYNALEAFNLEFYQIANVNADVNYFDSESNLALIAEEINNINSKTPFISINLEANGTEQYKYVDIDISNIELDIENCDTESTCYYTVGTYLIKTDYWSTHPEADSKFELFISDSYDFQLTNEEFLTYETEKIGKIHGITQTYQIGQIGNVYVNPLTNQVIYQQLLIDCVDNLFPNSQTLVFDNKNATREKILKYGIHDMKIRFLKNLVWKIVDINSKEYYYDYIRYNDESISEDEREKINQIYQAYNLDPSKEYTICMENKSYSYINDDDELIVKFSNGATLYIDNLSRRIFKVIDEFENVFLIQSVNNIDNIVLEETKNILYSKDGTIERADYFSKKRYALIEKIQEDEQTVIKHQVFDYNFSQIPKKIKEEYLYFDANYQLIKIADVMNGQYILIDYTNSFVDTIRGYEKDGESSFEYRYLYNDDSITLINDMNFKKEIYMFDSSGNLTQIIDDIGNTVVNEYDDITLKTNKKASSFSKEPLVNGRFEQDMYGWTKLSNDKSEEVVYENLLNKKALKIKKTNSNSNLVGAYQAVSLEPGRVYKLKGLMKKDSSFPNNNILMVLKYEYWKNVEVVTTISSTETTTEYVKTCFSNQLLSNISCISDDLYMFETEEISIPSDATNAYATVTLSFYSYCGELYVYNVALSEEKINNNLVLNPILYGTLNYLPEHYEFINRESQKDLLTKDVSTSSKPKALGSMVYKITGNTEMEKTMKQTIDIQGFKNDEYFVSCFVKGNLNEGDVSTLKIKFINENDSEVFEVPMLSGVEYYQRLFNTFTATIDYNQIEIALTYKGSSEIYVTGFELAKAKKSKPKEEKIICYDNNNLPISICTSFGKITSIEYDYDKLYQITKLKQKNLEVGYIYDNKDRCTKQIITTENGSTIFNEKNVQEEVVETIDSNGLSTYEYYDNLGRTIKNKYPNNSELENSYDSMGRLTKTQMIVDLTEYGNEFTYDDINNTIEVKSKNNTKYIYEYNDHNLLSVVKLNELVLITYTYTNNQLLEKITTLTDNYEYHYNSDKQLEEVIMNEKLYKKFEYNANQTIYKEIDYSYESDGTQKFRTIYYNYNIDGSVEKITTIDENKKLTQKIISANSEQSAYNITYASENTKRTQMYVSPNLISQKFSCDKYIYDIVNKYNFDIVKGDNIEKGLFGLETTSASITDYYKDSSLNKKAVSLLEVNDRFKYNLTTYNQKRRISYIENEKYDYDTTIENMSNQLTYFIWFKPTGTYSKTYLGKFIKPTDANSSEETYVDFYITDTGYLAFKANEDDMYETTGKVIKNVWNFASITIYNEDNKTKYILKLNDESKMYIGTEKLELSNIKILEVGRYVPPYTGGSLNVGANPTNRVFNMSVVLIGITSNEINSTDLKSIYDLGKEEYIKNKNEMFDVLSYQVNDNLEKFNYVDFNLNLTMNNQQKPTETNNHVFELDTNLKKHVLKCNTYEDFVKYETCNHGNISYIVRFKLNETTVVKRNILKVLKENNEYLGLYVDNTKQLKLTTLNYSLLSLNTTITDNNYHTLLVTNTDTLNIYLDGVLIKTLDKLPINNYTVSLGNNLYGSIELFGYTNETNINTTISYEPVVYRNIYDELGRVIKKEYQINDTLYTSKYTYTKDEITKQVNNLGQTIKYSFDKEMNIYTKDDGTYIYEYIFDNVGRLIEEKIKNKSTNQIKTYIYEYDENGNIQSKKINDVEVQQYSYDSNYKDKLVKINNTTINYNGLYPTNMLISNVNQPLTWTNGRLTSIGSNTYEYNSDGIRIKKTVNGITTTYKLDGTKILEEETTINNQTETIKYIYDTNGMLINIITREGCYYYERDITGNILGLVDKNGYYVVKYTYDAWGNVLDKQILVNSIAAQYNPFIYKGYYYDVETNLALVSSRYYSLELGRFIQPADISSLDPQSINGLNLYTYAVNNPIAIKYDSSISSYGSGMVSSIGFGASSTGTSSVSNQAAPEWLKLLVGAIPDLKVGLDYLTAQGTKSSFAYATAKTYRFPILGGTHSAFTKGKYSYGDLVGASFRKITTDSARGGFGAFAKNFAKTSVYTLGVNFAFNLYENNWQIDDAMIQDTLIDTAIGVSSYYMAAGTMSLLTAGALVAFGWNVPGLIVVGGVVVLSIAYDALIRWITGYDE